MCCVHTTIRMTHDSWPPSADTVQLLSRCIWQDIYAYIYMEFFTIYYQ